MNYRWNDARFMTGLKRDFHFNDTLSPLPFVRLDVSINGERGEEGGSIIRGTEVGTKGADQRMAEIKRAINCRWAMRRGKVAKQRACKIYTKTIHFLYWFTSVNYNQRERLQSTRRNELNKIQDKKNFHSFSFDFRQRQQREFIFFLIVPFHHVRMDDT